MSWDANEIARTLAMRIFNRKALVMVPNCYWTGDECDLLVVRHDLRLVDVEVKISRSDLKADAKKDKWVDVQLFAEDGKFLFPDQRPAPTPRAWPRKIWKHYFALPEEIWKDGLEQSIPDASGVLFMREHKDGTVGVWVHRQAKPCRDAPKLGLEEVLSVARTANYRYWDLYQKVRPVRKAA